MVLLPSFAAEGQAAPAGWLRVLRRWLHLGRKGVIVAIRRAQPARLRELVEALEEIEPGFRFIDRAEDLLECEAGELVVLGLRADDLTWLNLNRPVFSQRKLRAVLWAEGELNVELKFRAPDMHDWVSHFVDCPPGVPSHALEGLELGLRWWPGVAWRGEGFDAAWVELGRGEPPPRERADRDYGELVELLEGSGDVPVRAWTGVETQRALTELRRVIAESGYEGTNVLLEPTISTPGWFPVSGACMSLARAAARLREGGVEEPCRAAAWLGLEPEAVELFAGWGVMPPRERSEREALVRERAGEAEIEAAVNLACSGLLLRALHEDGRVERGREGLVEATERVMPLRGLLAKLDSLAPTRHEYELLLQNALASARAQLGATDPDYLRILHYAGAYTMLAWPELGAELLLDERELAGEGLGAAERGEQGLLAWAHALLSRGRFSEVVELLEPHAVAHPPLARLLARALLRRGDRAAAERLLAHHDLPALAELESQALEDERREFFQRIVDAFMAQDEADAGPG